MELKKVGIMGGTFDPIHQGHLLAAEQALEQAKLTEVWFMPTFKPPHKQVDPNGATPEQRWEMMCRAIASNPSFHAVDYEIRQGGTSYTIHTIEAFQELYPQYQFFYIIGGDMVEYLPKWYRIEDLAKKIQFLGLSRPGYRLEVKQIPTLEHKVGYIKMPALDLSSTDIRQRIKLGRSIRYMVPESVYEYIKEHKIYV